MENTGNNLLRSLRTGHHNADLVTVGGVTHDRRCLSAHDEIIRLGKLLDKYRDAVRIDAKMDGPRFLGSDASALKRAWDADREEGEK